MLKPIRIQRSKARGLVDARDDEVGHLLGVLVVVLAILGCAFALVALRALRQQSSMNHRSVGRSVRQSMDGLMRGFILKKERVVSFKGRMANLTSI